MISRDFYKKPLFYYILIPVLLGIWPCLVAFLYLPNSKNAYQRELQIYKDANNVMFDILTIDDRSKGTAPAGAAQGFDYIPAINDAARSSGILGPSIKSEPMRNIEGKKIQEATVTIPATSITNFANFLYNLQKRWATLESQTINLEKQKGLPDTWKITIRFRYYF